MVDETKLLVETDSPFLPPQALRGSSNRPANLPAVLATLAEMRGVDLDRIIAASADAAASAFSLVP